MNGTLNTLPNHRISGFWARIKSIGARTQVLDAETKRELSMTFLPDSIRFFKQRYPFRWADDHHEFFVMMTLMYLAGGIYTMSTYTNVDQFWAGIYCLVLGISGVFYYWWIYRNSVSSDRMLFTKESLQLPGKGEFRWKNIDGFRIELRTNKWQVLLILLSDGTVVECPLRPFKTSSPHLKEAVLQEDLWLVLHEYWKRGRNVLPSKKLHQSN